LKQKKNLIRETLGRDCFLIIRINGNKSMKDPVGGLQTSLQSQSCYLVVKTDNKPSYPPPKLLNVIQCHSASGCNNY
jgi:hypothetical protein